MAGPTTTFKGQLPGFAPDVKIHTPYQVFFLHSQILQLCSRWFATSMSDVWWNTESYIDGHRYCYDFDCDIDGASTLLPRREESIHLDMQGINLKGAPQDKETMPNPEAIEKLCIAYEDMFKCFYRLPVHLPDTTRSEGLLSLADQFEALNSVKDTVSSCVLNWGDLEKQIKLKPVEFIIMGHKLESYRIFKDAFIHIVGRQCGKSDPTALWWDSSDLAISEPVLGMIMRETSKLNKLVSNTMRELLQYSDYGHGYKSQLINSFVSYGGHGNEGVLFREVMKVGSRLDESVAGGIKGLFRSLGKNNLSSSVDEAYLTCAWISENEMPWKM